MDPSATTPFQFLVDNVWYSVTAAAAIHFAAFYGGQVKYWVSDRW